MCVSRFATRSRDPFDILNEKEDTHKMAQANRALELKHRIQ